MEMSSNMHQFFSPPLKLFYDVAGIDGLPKEKTFDSILFGDDIIKKAFPVGIAAMNLVYELLSVSRITKIAIV